LTLFSLKFMESKIVKKEFINNEEAAILIDAYKNNIKIIDQGDLGDIKVCWIKNGFCKVEFDKGKIKYYCNPFF